MGSKDGKGRTLWEILTGRNKRDLTPLELQYHNPLGARCGNTISLDHEPGVAGINFVIDKISVYETRIKSRKFYHTDYHLRGIALGMDRPIRVRLRLIPDEDESNKLGCKVQLLYLYDEMEWDHEFYGNVLNNDKGEFWVNQDDEGNELNEPRRYWRVEDVLDPYHARVTILADKDGDGTIDDKELERLNVAYWDFHRETVSDLGQPVKEYLWIEMNDTTKFFTFLRGTEVEAYQITVI